MTFSLLVICACEKPEDVLPTPPQSEGSLPPAAPEEYVEKFRPSAGQANAEVFQNGDIGDLPFRILIPRGFDSTSTYPLHIFLHGIGERGTDNEKQLSVGASSFLVDSVRENYRSFVVFPQCPATGYWFDHHITTQLRDLIDALRSRYRIDENQISIGGFSMGAYGTFAMVAQYPGLFSAAVAISGDGDEEKASLMAKPRWQVFAGEKDHIVPSIKTEKMARALQQAGASVSFKLYPLADHSETWINAFSEPDFFRRLFTEVR